MLRSQRQPGAIAIRRTIHVVVRNDRLTILPEQGDGAALVVAVTGSLDSAVDNFVDEVSNRMQGWGLAGQGLYWKPILVLRSTADGAATAQRVARRLQGSGIDIQLSPPQRR